MYVLYRKKKKKLGVQGSIQDPMLHVAVVSLWFPSIWNNSSVFVLRDTDLSESV